MQRRRALATALFFLLLAACAQKDPPPLAISDCRLDARPVTLMRIPAVTMYATVENGSEKTIVSTRMDYVYRYRGAALPHPPAILDNYWRIPPHHTVHFKWHQDISSRWVLESQTMQCSLFAVSFADGSIWASKPGELAPGNAERHHGPL